MAEKIIGTLSIDLGNTNTVLAFQGEKSSTPILLEMPLITKSPGIVPTAIWFDENKGEKEIIIGMEALKIFNKNNQIKIIGPRHGEKYHESLCTSEEMSKAVNEKKYYRIPADLRNINYDIHSKKNKALKDCSPYSSNNTKMLNLSEIISLIKKTKNKI